MHRRSFLYRTVAVIGGAILPFETKVLAAASGPARLIANVVPEPSSIGVIGSLPNQVVSGNISDGLIYYDRNFTPQPQLAESWTSSDDGLSITFKLRQGVRWHDGKPFTSDDVAHSFEVVKKTSALAAATFQNVVSVDTPDAHTAVVKLSRPAPVIWSYLDGGQLRLVPKHLYAGTDPLTNPWNNKPIGTGPFVFKEWVRGSHITLDKNPDYWDKGKPYLDGITFRIIPDIGAREAALETGEIQYSPLSPVALSSARRLRKNKDLVVESGGWAGMVKVFFFDFNLRRKTFQDVRVRRAFAHAIDNQAVANLAWFGFATPSLGPVPSSQKEFFNPDVPLYPYDPKKAEALLDEAGLKRGPDGVRLRIDHINHSFGEEYKRAGDLFKQYLKAVGIELELRNYDLSTQLRKLFVDRDFDTASYDYAAGSDPQIGVIRRFWSKSIQDGVPWSNGTSYSSEKTDQVIQGIVNEGDPEKRKAYIRELQVVTQNDLPSISVVDVRLVRIYSSRLTGVDINPLGGYAALTSVAIKS